VRIFTPTFEMPFAGHRHDGRAHVVRELTGAGDTLTLELRAGIIAVDAVGDVWTLQATRRRIVRLPRRATSWPRCSVLLLPISLPGFLAAAVG
jgi:predicted PhzF superfamily epimerase YddE/YHI9